MLLDKASRNQGVNMSTVRNYAIGSLKIHRSSPWMIHTESPFKDGDRIGTSSSGKGSMVVSNKIVVVGFTSLLFVRKKSLSGALRDNGTYGDKAHLTTHKPTYVTLPIAFCVTR